MARSRAALWGPVVFYLVFIFTLSSISHPPELPALSDKNLHALLYSGLGFLLARALAGGLHRRVTFWMACSATMLASGYGLSDELHQYFVPSRQVEFLDAVADTMGASVATFALYAWGIIRSRYESRNPSGRT